MKNNHTQLKRLAAISFVLMLCLSVVPFMAPSASAAEDVTPLGSSTGGRGKVVIGFDDGRRSVYENGFPIMAAAGVPGTVWMITDTIGSEDYNGQPQLTETQLLELQAAGWEIGSHTTSHIDLSKVSLEDAIADMEASKAALESIGINCTSLAYPWGNYTSEVAAAGSEIYEWQRSAYKNPGYNVLYKSDYPDRLPTIGALSPKNNEEAFAAIDRAVETDSVVILFWHSVASNGQVGGGSVANLHDIVDHIQKTGIEPITMSEILALPELPTSGTARALPSWRPRPRTGIGTRTGSSPTTSRPWTDRSSYGTTPRPRTAHGT